MPRGRRLPNFGRGSDLELVNASDFEPLLRALKERGFGGLSFVLDGLVDEFGWLVWTVIDDKPVFIFEPDDKVLRLWPVDC
jgi:hypothetical protein